MTGQSCWPASAASLGWMPTAAKRPRWVWANLTAIALVDAVVPIVMICSTPTSSAAFSTSSRSAQSRSSSRCACVSTREKAACGGRAHGLATSFASGMAAVGGRHRLVRLGAGLPGAWHVGDGTGLVADQFQAISRHLEALTTEVFMQAGVKLGDEIGVEAGRQVVNGSGSQAAKMVVQVAARIVPRQFPPVPTVSLVASPTATQASRALYTVARLILGIRDRTA